MRSATYASSVLVSLICRVNLDGVALPAAWRAISFGGNPGCGP